MPAAQIQPLNLRTQPVLAPATPFNTDQQMLGASRMTVRGPTLQINIIGHTQIVRVRVFWAEASGGTWFLAQTFNTVVGTPFQQKVRTVGAAWARVELTNMGAADTTPRFFLEELIDLRVRA